MSLKFLKPESNPDAINVLLCGPPKSGKSTGAATAPGGLLYLNLESRNALRNARRLAGERMLEADWRAGIFKTMNDVSFAVHDPKQADLIETVVVDPIGHLYRRLLEELSDRAIQPDIRMYLATQTYIERFCRKLIEAPLNTVLVCHDMPVKDEATGEVERLPFTGTTNPALGQKLMEMVDIVAYTGIVIAEDGRKHAQAQLIAAKGRRGGDRFDCLADETGVAELNLSAWIAKIHASFNTQPKKEAA